MMEFLWKPKKTMADMMKENEKNLNQGMRDMERECKRLEREGNKIKNKMKQAAQKNNPRAVRAHAKNLIRIENGCQKFIEMSGQLQATKINLMTIQSTQKMSDVLRTTTRLLMQTSAQCDLRQVQKIMMMFEHQNEMMAEKQEILDDTLNNVADEDGDDERINDIINETLDQKDIENLSNIGDLKIKKKETPNELSDEMLKKLAQLRK